MEMYRHYKNKKIYFKIMELINKTNDTDSVLYIDSYGKFYVRDKKDFYTKFKKEEFITGVGL